MLTFVALRRTRGASSVKQQPQPVRSTQSKPDLSECSLVAGSGRAKSQVMPVTCSRAAAMDGSDVGRRRRSRENVHVKRLRCPSPTVPVRPRCVGPRVCGVPCKTLHPEKKNSLPAAGYLYVFDYCVGRVELRFSNQTRISDTDF